MTYCRSLLSQWSRRNHCSAWARDNIETCHLLRQCFAEIIAQVPGFNSDAEDVLTNEEQNVEEKEVGGRVGNRGLQKDREAKIDAKKATTELGQ